MFNESLAQNCVNSLLESGVDKAQVHVKNNEKYELNIATGEISLLRTTFDTNLSFKGIKEGKEGIININNTDEVAIKEAVSIVNELCKTAEKDEDKDISQEKICKEFHVGDEKPNLDRMYELISNFTIETKKRYPKVVIEEAYLDFTKVNERFLNSNDVDFRISKGMYNFDVMFTAKDGEKSSSFNYTGFSTLNLDKELIDSASIDILLRQSSEQLETISLEGKFEGDVFITPDCIGDFINYYMYTFLRDDVLISGSSILKDKLNEKVASDKLTIHSNPISEELVSGYFVTQDGFEAKNSTIIDKGVLKTFLLSLYGANKTKKERAVNDGESYVIDPGNKSFEEIVKSINKGILLCRFSGGQPSANGDFSGVAKNSYYIENGEIKYPISETMITGNLYKMFNNIKDISKERINFGSALLPWVCVSDIMISGK